MCSLGDLIHHQNVINLFVCIYFFTDLKNSYVDVFNPSGKPNGPTMPIPDVINSAPGPQMNFFVPQPITDPNAPLDFLTPGGVPHLPEQQVG